ncbi:DUF6758 family protein [Allostreptomyces psammosilenae]|uniref:Phosphotransacetylase n=1 Tax=Allostreptomyces psammosilenae TaxID=1892865 RepID=A0A853A0F4_9ACTN|nr:DUF6758 family protein [Allostreptomyces psammosilenae]NYI08103.1 hypothetical protein [Allostreptomyces psammosilenae]
MKGEPRCPRCGGPLRRPGLYADDWQCDAHGGVPPLHPAAAPSAAALGAVVERAGVPVWLPWPLPRGWLHTGAHYAGDGRSGAPAVAVACSGPGPLGGLGEMVLVSEELGVGLGAHYAGLPGYDPGPALAETPSDAKVTAAGRPTPLWSLRDAPADRAVFVGEAMGMWLWAVLWPNAAGVLMYDDLALSDLRDDTGPELEALPCGALSPRLG